MHLVWFSGIAAVGLFGAISWYLAPLQPGVLALQFAFTAQAFGDVMQAWTGAPLERFRSHWPADFALLLSYGAFGHLLTTRTKVFSALQRRHRTLVAWVLPLAAVFDATENAFHGWLTEGPRVVGDAPYLLAATCASAKWLLLIAYASAVVVSLGWRVWAKRAQT